MLWFESYFATNILPLLPSPKESKILDLGCGYGRTLLALKMNGYENIFGVDISEKQISYAKNYFNLNECTQMSASEFLGNKEMIYDCVLAIDLFEHLDLDELVEICQKIYISLKMGGRLIVQVPNGLALINPIIYGDITHVRAFTPDSIKQVLNLSGFSGPFEFHECYSQKSLLEKLKTVIYKIIIKQLINLFVFITYKKLDNDIFTNNFITVCRKI
ncbi:MAG: class I SAM-dependent methyltransferase [Stygiobacter sp.]